VRFFLLVIFLISSTACQTNVEDQLQNYSYELSENGCSTGKQTFATKDDMCIGLKNNALNNNCAYSSRQSYFTGQSCTGSFTVFVVSPAGEKTFVVLPAIITIHF
jgi:hypothetical protein